MRRTAIALVALGSAALVAALAVAGLGVALSRGWQRERLRAALETALSDVLGADVAIGALEGPLVPSLRIRNLRIGPPNARSLALESLSIEWDPAVSWDSREIAIRSLVLEGARIFATRDESGRLRAPGLLPDGPGARFALPLPLRVERTALERLRLRVAWQQAGEPAELRAEGRGGIGAFRWPADGRNAPTASIAIDVASGGAARRWLETAHLEASHEAGRVRVVADAALAPALGSLALRARSDAQGALEILDLRLDGGAYPPLALARPTLVRRDGERFVVQELEIRSARQSLLLTGAISPERFDALRLVARDLDASLVARLAGASGIEGRFSGEATLDGPLARPSGRARVAWLTPQLDGWLAERIDAAAEWDERSAGIEADVVRGGRRELSLELALPLGDAAAGPWWERWRGGENLALPSQLRLVLRAHGLALEAFSRWLPERVRALRGELSGELSVRGGTQPRARGDLALAGLGIDLEGMPRPIEGARARLELGPDPAGLRIERLDVDVPELHVEASGALGLGGPRGLVLRAQVADLEALASAHGLERVVPGSLDAQLRLDGAWRHPSLAGSLVWRDPAPGLAGPSRVDIELATQGDWLSGDLGIWQDERIAARGELRHPYPEWSALDRTALAGPGSQLVVRAEDFELARFAPLLGRRVRDLRGRVDAAVTVRGGAGRPSLEGTLRAREVSLRVPALRQTFEPIEAELAFGDDALRVRRLRIGREGARAEITGSLRLDASLRPRSADLELAFERFPVSRSTLLRADLGGRARIEGPLDAPSLRGALALSDVRVHLAESGDPALREIRVITRDAARDTAPALREAPRGPSAFDRATIDLELTVPRNSWVRGQGANIEASGTLQLDKAPFDALRISGEVDALRGSYRFQGRRFDVQRGTVTFDGGAQPDPLLDIEARRRVSNVVVIVALSGRLSEPIVRLSSEPELPEDDVLAYLFFGRPARDLKAAGTTQQELEAAAGSFAAGIALGEASGVLEDLVPIDTFDVEMREDGRSADLSLGKYVTDDLFVTYERRLGSDPVDGVRLHLRLGDNWSIATDAATDESAGVDLIWSLDY